MFFMTPLSFFGERISFVSAQNQDFYLEEQQKKIEEHFNEAIEIARTSGIPLDKTGPPPFGSGPAPR